MLNNSNSSVRRFNQLAYIEDVIKEAFNHTMDVGLDEYNHSTHTNNHETPSQNHPKLPNIGDGNCYFPCMKRKGIKKKNI